MLSKNSCSLAAAAVAAVFASTAFAGGEAGPLNLRDLGARYVGYTTKEADKGSVDVANPMFVQYMLPANKKHQ